MAMAMAKPCVVDDVPRKQMPKIMHRICNMNQQTTLRSLNFIVCGHSYVVTLSVLLFMSLGCKKEDGIVAYLIQVFHT